MTKLLETLSWKEWVAVIIGITAFIRLAEWFIKLQFTKFKNEKINPNGNFDDDDKRRLLEMGKNCFIILEYVKNLREWHSKTDNTGKFIWYKDSNLERIMNDQLQLIGKMQETQEENFKSILQIQQSLDKIAIIQDGTVNVLQQIQLKLNQIKMK